jgi:hypothetical protein
LSFLKYLLWKSLEDTMLIYSKPLSILEDRPMIEVCSI